MREAIALITIAVHLAAGTWLILSPGPWWWFKAAAALVLYARIFSGLEFSQGLNSVRRWLRLSQGRALQLMHGAYVLAGVLAAIGALLSLELAFGLIVASGALSWTWFWGYMLRQLLGPSRPHPSSAA